MKPIFGIDSFITKWKHIKYTLSLYTLTALFFSLFPSYMIYISLIASVICIHMYIFYKYFCQRLRGFSKFCIHFKFQYFLCSIPIESGKIPSAHSTISRIWIFKCSHTTSGLFLYWWWYWSWMKTKNHFIRNMPIATTDSVSIGFQEELKNGTKITKNDCSFFNGDSKCRYCLIVLKSPSTPSSPLHTKWLESFFFVLNIY